MKFASVALVIGIGTWSTGCASSYFGASGFRNQGGLKKAAFDLGCDESQLQVQEFESLSVGVTGCGRRARYENVGPGGGQWVLNGKVED